MIFKLSLIDSVSEKL